MDPAVQIALIGAVGSFAASLLAAAMAIISNRRGIVNAADIAATKDNIILLEKNTNSIKDALVKVTGEAEFAKGLKSGIETVVQVQMPQVQAIPPAAAPIATPQLDHIKDVVTDTNTVVQVLKDAAAPAPPAKTRFKR